MASCLPSPLAGEGGAIAQQWKGEGISPPLALAAASFPRAVQRFTFSDAIEDDVLKDSGTGFPSFA